MKYTKPREEIEVEGTFKVDIGNFERATVCVRKPLHFTLHHCKKSGGRYAKCKELEGLTTETHPVFDKNHIYFDIYRNIVYMFFQNKEDRTKIREYCRIVKFE